ncbi:MAG: SgcJ/EcaC family oxidoreductase [Rhodothermaceae bacterium]|nr:SgcJ/EcaC family oxidoreductase [Rhodothermaceae bacterium]
MILTEHLPRNAAFAFAGLALLFVGCTAPSSPPPSACVFTAEDEISVREAVQRYVDAWLSNEADAVMATLTEDIVLQPHHGDDPVVGAEAVRAWWFPEGPPTVITAFTVETRVVSGCGSLAYAWGRSSVIWTTEGESFSNEGNALSVLSRGDDGTWKIAHQIWNDPPTQTL